MLAHSCLFFTCLLLAAPQQPNQPSAQGTLVIEERSTDIPVRTPDPQVRYRLTKGGFISRTTDGGATWNGQLVSATRNSLTAVLLLRTCAGLLVPWESTRTQLQGRVGAVRPLLSGGPKLTTFSARVNRPVF